jgi:hypothetical protein
VPITNRTPGGNVCFDISLAIGEWEVKLQVVAWRLFFMPVASKHIVDRVGAGDDVPRVNEETGTQHVSPKKNPGHAELKMVSYYVAVCVTWELLHHRGST